MTDRTSQDSHTRARSGGPERSHRSPQHPLVTCEGVTRAFDRASRGYLSRWAPSKSADRPSVTAVDDVSLSVQAGEFVGIKGPSGSGKSTLLHLLAALDVPSAGQIILDGENTTSLSERERARLRLETVGLVFQRFHLLPALSARANVAVPMVEKGIGKRDRRSRAEDLLARVGLGDRLEHTPSELSGGEQQRVAIARALATDPALIVADEPTGELDTDTGDRILDVFGDLVADDRAVILASHDAQALDRADRIIRLQDGQRIDV